MFRLNLPRAYKKV